MENLTLSLISSPKTLIGFSSRNQRGIFLHPNNNNSRNGNFIVTRRDLFISSSLSARAASALPPKSRIHVLDRFRGERFASIFSSTSKESSSVGVNPPLYVPPPPPPSQFGSPLFWIGVGVGFSAIFSWNYAMQQAFKTVMGQMNSQNSQFSGTANQFSGPGFSSGPPFPFPMPPTTGQPTSVSPASSQPSVTVNVPPSKVQEAPTKQVSAEKEVKTEQKKYAFIDVSPEETSEKNPFDGYEDLSGTSSPKDSQFPGVYENGAATWDPSSLGSSGSQSSGKAGSGMSVEALEKMMEDPTVQKMVYPYLPEEMRNPTTFKWMLQNPQYRQQLEEMLNNMGGSSEWDNRMMDSLKNFDLSSPEVKQQFEQVGLTPEEVISKIMANPDVAMAFQNPRVQAAIMDCSQNPMSIAKYQNDKEVMDVFNKISELFPGVAGSP